MLRRTTTKRCSVSATPKIPTRFLLPSFSQTEKGKVPRSMLVLHQHALASAADCGYSPAIASQGFPADREGRYVFATRVDPPGQLGSMKVAIGFTSTPALGPLDNCVEVGTCGMNGVAVRLSNGYLESGNGDSVNHERELYFPHTTTKNTKTIVSIFTISKNSSDTSGFSRSVQFIVNDIEGPVQELHTSDFDHKYGGDEIFPVMSIGFSFWFRLTCIPFGQIKSRSPVIDELMKEFIDEENVKANSTDAAAISETEVLTSHLRNRIGQFEQALARLEERNNKIKTSGICDKHKEARNQQLVLLHQELDLAIKQMEIVPTRCVVFRGLMFGVNRLGSLLRDVLTPSRRF